MTVEHMQLGLRRSAGRRIRGTQQDPHCRHSHSAPEVARYSGLEENSSQQDRHDQADRGEAHERTGDGP